MKREDIKLRSSTGQGEFDCYVAQPDDAGRKPAIVLASAVHGVDKDIREIADEFAAEGYIAAAPDLFWRTIPGPLPRSDKRTAERSEPRFEVVTAGEADLADTLAHLRTLPACNGRAVVMGFCYGGPYAVIGPKRLGFEAGVSCHGSAMLSFIDQFDGVSKPVVMVWGDQDNRAPADVLNAYRQLPPRQKNVEVHIFPGVQHGFMMRDDERYSPETRAFAMARTLKLLADLR